MQRGALRIAAPQCSEKSTWKGIFTRRSSAEKPKPPKRGDPNASLRELALQQVLESRRCRRGPTPNSNLNPDQVLESCEDVNCQRGTVVGPMVEGRYPVEVVVSGAKKRIRIRLENLRSVNI